MRLYLSSTITASLILSTTAWRATGVRSNSRKRKRLQAIAIPVTVNAKGVRSRLGNGLKPKSVTALLTHGTSTAMHKALTCPGYTDAERLSVGMNQANDADPR